MEKIASCSQSAPENYTVALKDEVKLDEQLFWVAEIHSQSLAADRGTGIRYRFEFSGGYSGNFDLETVDRIKRSEDVEGMDEVVKQIVTCNLDI